MSGGVRTCCTPQVYHNVHPGCGCPALYAACLWELVRFCLARGRVAPSGARLALGANGVLTTEAWSGSEARRGIESLQVCARGGCFEPPLR